MEIDWIKIELNSNYGSGVNHYDQAYMYSIIELKQELIRLKQLELRKEKIQKIQSKLCQ